MTDPEPLHHEADSVRKAISIHGGDIPNKSPDPVLLVDLVQLLHVFEKQRHHFFFHHGKGGRVHFRPGMGSHAGFPPESPGSVHHGPLGEAFYLELLEDVIHPFGEGLVVGYEDCFFHLFVFFTACDDGQTALLRSLGESSRAKVRSGSPAVARRASCPF